MTRVVIFSIVATFPPTWTIMTWLHSDSDTHVYTLKVLPFVPYTDVVFFFLNLVSLISEGYKNIALASYSPMWQYHRRVAMKALRLVYTERLVTNFFFFFCLLTVWPPLCYMYIMFRSGQKVWRQKVRQRRDTNILSSYCLTIGIL